MRSEKKLLTLSVRRAEWKSFRFTFKTLFAYLEVKFETLTQNIPNMNIWSVSGSSCILSNSIMTWDTSSIFSILLYASRTCLAMSSIS